MEFITKDNGDRQRFDGGMQRDTENARTRWDLIPNELFDSMFTTTENATFIKAFRGWQKKTVKPEEVIRALVQLECAGDTMEFLKRVAELMTRGAEKYGEWNWTKGKDQEVHDRYLRSADRHFKQYLMGERTEDHAAALYFNLNGEMYTSAFIQKTPEQLYRERPGAVTFIKPEPWVDPAKKE